MKIQNLMKLTMAVLVAAQFVNGDIVRAESFKTSITTLKTADIAALEDPYFQIKSYQIKELTDEEARNLNLPVSKPSDKKMIKIVSKGFVPPSASTGPHIPNVPTLPNAPKTPDDPTKTPDDSTTPSEQPKGFLDNIIMTVDKLVAVGEKIIPLIKSGQSVVTNTPMKAICVLPKSDGVDPVVHEMGGWSIPVSKHYKITYKNGWGSEVVSFIYSVSFQYNGSTNGKGHYLAGVRSSATEINTSWGFDLDASSQLIQIANVGTQEDVIAGATIEMTYTVKNWTKNLTSIESFHVTGDGRFYKLD